MPVALMRWTIAAFVLALSAGAALADRIDGNWCSPAGASMTIEGPHAVIPSGRSLEGLYDRHHFQYVVPEGDDNAGAIVEADLIDEEHMWVTVLAPGDTTPGTPEMWKRCKVISQARIKKLAS